MAVLTISMLQARDVTSNDNLSEMSCQIGYIVNIGGSSFDDLFPPSVSSVSRHEPLPIEIGEHGQDKDGI